MYARKKPPGNSSSHQPAAHSSSSGMQRSVAKPTGNNSDQGVIQRQGQVPKPQANDTLPRETTYDHKSTAVTEILPAADKGGQNKTTELSAFIKNDMVMKANSKETKAGIDPPGWEYLRLYNSTQKTSKKTGKTYDKIYKWVRFHLLNNHIGGNGHDAKFLTPAPMTANSQWSQNPEKEMKKVIKGGSSLWYKVNVEYWTTSDARPEFDRSKNATNKKDYTNNITLFPKTITADWTVYPRDGAKQDQTTAVTTIVEKPNPPGQDEVLDLGKSLAIVSSTLGLTDQDAVKALKTATAGNDSIKNLRDLLSPLNDSANDDLSQGNKTGKDNFDKKRNYLYQLYGPLKSLAAQRKLSKDGNLIADAEFTEFLLTQKHELAEADVKKWESRSQQPGQTVEENTGKTASTKTDTPKPRSATKSGKPSTASLAAFLKKKQREREKDKSRHRTGSGKTSTKPNKPASVAIEELLIASYKQSMDMGKNLSASQRGVKSSGFKTWDGREPDQGQNRKLKAVTESELLHHFLRKLVNSSDPTRGRGGNAVFDRREISLKEIWLVWNRFLQGELLSGNGAPPLMMDLTNSRAEEFFDRFATAVGASHQGTHESRGRVVESLDDAAMDESDEVGSSAVDTSSSANHSDSNSNNSNSNSNNSNSNSNSSALSARSEIDESLADFIHNHFKQKNAINASNRNETKTKKKDQSSPGPKPPGRGHQINRGQNQRDRRNYSNTDSKRGAQPPMSDRHPSSNQSSSSRQNNSPFRPGGAGSSRYQGYSNRPGNNRYNTAPINENSPLNFNGPNSSVMLGGMDLDDFGGGVDTMTMPQDSIDHMLAAKSRMNMESRNEMRSGSHMSMFSDFDDEIEKTGFERDDSGNLSDTDINTGFISFSNANDLTDFDYDYSGANNQFGLQNEITPKNYDFSSTMKPTMSSAADDENLVSPGQQTDFLKDYSAPRIGSTQNNNNRMTAPDMGLVAPKYNPDTKNSPLGGPISSTLAHLKNMPVPIITDDDSDIKTSNDNTTHQNNKSGSTSGRPTKASRGHAYGSLPSSHPRNKEDQSRKNKHTFEMVVDKSALKTISTDPNRRQNINGEYVKVLRFLPHSDPGKVILEVRHAYG